MSTDRLYNAGSEAVERRPLMTKLAIDPLKPNSAEYVECFDLLKLKSAECRIYVCLLKSAKSRLFSQLVSYSFRAGACAYA